MIASKTCRTCKVAQPLENFHRDKNAGDGHRGECKSCAKARTATWQRQNPERAREAVDRWKREHADEIHERDRERYWTDPEKHRARARDYYNQDPEKYRARARDYYAEQRATRIAEAEERVRLAKEAGIDPRKILPQPQE